MKLQWKKQKELKNSTFKRNIILEHAHSMDELRDGVLMWKSFHHSFPGVAKQFDSFIEVSAADGHSTTDQEGDDVDVLTTRRVIGCARLCED